MKDYRFIGLTINQTLIISHVVLVLMLILGMSISRFNYESELHLQQASQRAEDVLLQHVSDLSLLVAGRNYSTIMRPAYLDELYSHKNLLFFDIKGVSDYQSHLVHVRYLRENKLIWREDMSLGDLNKIKSEKEKFENLLKQTPEGDAEKRAKITYILNKSILDYQQGVQNLAISQKYINLWKEPLSSDLPYYFDAQLNQLHMFVPLRNKEGRLWGVFDVRELALIQKRLLNDILFEALLAIIVSFILILIVTKRLVAPIKSLSMHMSGAVENIKIKDIKEVVRKDEIGALARTFVRLVAEIQSQVIDLKEKSNTDALTGLGSRYQYDQQAESLLKKALISRNNFVVMVCDIDNFKVINDTYGHTEGDRIIQSVSKTIVNNLSKNDRCYRIGGDEFVILIDDYRYDEHLIKAEKIRQSVEDLNLDKSNSSITHQVSISLGLVFIEADDFYAKKSDWAGLYGEMFNKADQQLYFAKHHGRNKIVSAKFIPRGNKSFL